MLVVAAGAPPVGRRGERARAGEEAPDVPSESAPLLWDRSQKRDLDPGTSIGAHEIGTVAVEDDDGAAEPDAEDDEAVNEYDDVVVPAAAAAEDEDVDTAAAEDAGADIATAAPIPLGKEDEGVAAAAPTRSLFTTPAEGASEARATTGVVGRLLSTLQPERLQVDVVGTGEARALYDTVVVGHPSPAVAEPAAVYTGLQAGASGRE